MKLCEGCNQDHSGVYGSGRFCSSRCARSFSTKNKRSEINGKVSQSLKGKNFVSKEKRSEVLQNRWKNADEDSLRRARERFSQASKERWKDENYREKMKGILLDPVNIEKRKETIKRLVEEGKWHGWVNNPNGSSYAEKYFEDYFTSLSISFRREVKIGTFFVDFLFANNIVLEIDGKQHEQESNRLRDEKKDKFLIESGYTVHRIKWKNVNGEHGRAIVHQQTAQFLKILRP